jgi:hypothetical protein
MEPPISTWEEAERRLYPSMMTQPDAVAGLLHLIRTVADRLERADTVEALAEAWSAAPQIVGAAAEMEGIDRGSFDQGIVAGAAFALRYRELMAHTERRDRRRRIDEARAHGDAWVVLDEAGVAEAPFPTPYRRVEMRLSDGYGLRSTAELDPDSGGIVHAVEELWLDPASGEMAGGDGEASRRAFTDPAAWRREVDDRRRRTDPPPEALRTDPL